MNLSDFRINTATAADILMHLKECSSQFSPPLDRSVDLLEYAVKLASKAVTFEFWMEAQLIGLVAVYYNNMVTREAYISHVCVLKGHKQRGVATLLMTNVIKYGVAQGFHQIKLQVHIENEPAISLYRKFGFEIVSTLTQENKFVMTRAL